MSSKIKVKIKAKLKGDVVVVKCLISHPMETGMRKDKKTGKLIPANFISEVVAEVAGKQVFVANYNSSVSKDPYLAFKYKGAKADMIKITWKDNMGNTGMGEGKVK
jgi:sulfur-oxidizing protein SoxZ